MKNLKVFILFISVFFLLQNSNAQFSVHDISELMIQPGEINYYTNDWVFGNILQLESRGWRYESDNSAVDFADLDENAYPTIGINSSNIVFAQPYQGGTDLPAGMYEISWEGNGEVSCNTSAAFQLIDDSQLNRKIYRALSDLTTGIEISIISSEVFPNHVKNVKCWMPDPSDPDNKTLEPLPDSSEFVFHPLFIERLQIAEVLRMGSWFNTSRSPEEEWNERRPKDYCFQTGNIYDKITPGGTTAEPTGASWEWIIALVNAANKDAWLQVPHAASDDYVRKMAQLIAGKDPDGNGSEGLKPGLKIYLEYSNEIWSGGGRFPCGNYAQTMADAEGISRGTWVGRRNAQIWKIFQEEFEGTEDLIRVLALWSANGNSFNIDAIEEAISYGASQAATYGLIKPDVISPTTYFGNSIEMYVAENYNEQDYLNPTQEMYDDIFSEWERRILSGEMTVTGVDVTTGGGFTQAIVDFSTNYDLPIVAYEGGVGPPTNYFKVFCLDDSTYYNDDCTNSISGELRKLEGTNVDWSYDPFTDFMATLQRDSHIADLYRIHLHLAKSRGLRMHCAFVMTGGFGKYGMFGHLEYLNQSIDTNEVGYNVKYKFLIDWLEEIAPINEIGYPINSAPDFVTKVLPAGVTGQTYNADIEIANGDGSIKFEIVGGHLPDGLSYSQIANNKIRVSGTPSKYENISFLLMALDGDNDPVWRIFTIDILDGINPVQSIETYADTQIRPGENGSGDWKNTNYGENKTIRSNEEQYCYFKFNLDQMSNSPVLSAKLKLYVLQATSDITLENIIVKKHHDNWDEYVMTWLTAPLPFPGDDSIVDVIVGNLGWVEFDVTDYLNQEYNGDKNISFFLESTQGSWITYNTKEATEFHPYLEITFDNVSYQLDVNNGSGTGVYAPITQVPILADAALAGQEFDQWTGLGINALVTDVYSESTLFEMPSTDYTITATYKDLPTYTLLVNKGTGSGEHWVGKSVSIAANAPLGDSVFNTWTGDIAYLTNSNEESTTLIMPAQSISLTATYRSDAIETYTLTVINGTIDGTSGDSIADYPEAAIVPISANITPVGYKFVAWLGETQYLDDSQSINTYINIPTADVEVTASFELITYQVIFTVDDGSTFIENASVTINGETKLTNSSGQAIFELPIGSGYNYSIISSGYINSSGSINVVSADINQAVSLIEITELFSVTFVVKDGINPIEGVKVEFNDSVKYSNTNGELVFYGIPSTNGMDYTISYSNYQSQIGTIDVSEDMNESISIQAIVDGISKKEAQNILVYPNPVNDIFNIRINKNSYKNMTITNIAGKVISNVNLTGHSNEFKIDVSQYSKGFYMITLINDSGKYSSRFIIE